MKIQKKYFLEIYYRESLHAMVWNINTYSVMIKKKIIDPRYAFHRLGLKYIILLHLLTEFTRLTLNQFTSPEKLLFQICHAAVIELPEMF